MTDLHHRFFITCLILHLSVCECSDIIVESFDGENVTLPCKYDSQYHGKCHICWTRGDIPAMGCRDEIIGSDGDRVVRRKSSRYQLEGEIQHGDVSLTISNVRKTDSGKYGCRIHIPGFFNDEMHYIHLFVKYNFDTTQENSSGLNPTASPETSPVLLCSSHTTQGNSSVSYVHDSPPVEHRDNVITSAVIVSFLLLLLTAISVIIILKQRRKNRTAAEIAQNAENSMVYSNTGSSVALYSREVAVENIYHIQPESHYEQWN